MGPASIGCVGVVVGCVAAALLGAGDVQARGSADRQPNIVLIVVDDLGYGDPGCYGGALVPTPAIDSLAADGARFTDGYVTAPVCAPSRCGLITGAYNQRFGIQWNEDQYQGGGRGYTIADMHQLLPQALAAGGYVTGHIGKWNVGADVRGRFDETYDVIDWEADYFPDDTGHYVGVNSDTERASSKRQNVLGPARSGDEYLTDRIGRHAVEFVEKHKDGGKPFFLFLAFNAVHTPFQAKKEVIARFPHLEPPLNFYAALLASLDENIGRVLAALPENTIVAFVSDNGPAKMPVPIWPEGWPKNVLAGSAGPLRGQKGQFLEGGIRVPFLLRWPGRLKAGTEFKHPVSTMDLYPTFCAAAGIPIPAGTKLDGVNLLPHLSGAEEGMPHDMLFWKSGEEGAVRHGDWKLVIGPSEPAMQLFNLAADVGEKRDVADDNPEVLQQLRKAWLDWSAAFPPRANPRPPGSTPGRTARGTTGAAAKPQLNVLFVAVDDLRPEMGCYGNPEKRRRIAGWPLGG